MSKPNFINHEIVFNPTGNEFDECRSELLGYYQLVKIEDYEYKFIKQPQLMIPKSIVESNWMKHLILCNSITQFEFERYDFLDKEEERFLKWVNTGKNENILYIYLASKRIGVDLVKVGER